MDEKQIKKLLLLESEPKLAIFDELQSLNDTLKQVIDAVNASKTTEITVSNPEDLKISLDPLQTNFDALRASVEAVSTAIENEKELDMSGVEKLLKNLVDKPVESVDMSAISSILDDILYAVQTSASHASDVEENPADTIVPAIEKGNKSLLALLNTINENIASIEIPNFDYVEIARIIKKNVSINVSGGGGGNSFVKRVSDGAYINPATEEKQDTIIAAVRPPSGAGKNGTRDLTAANTWYAVPSTVPTVPYILTATIKVSIGDITWGWDNTNTPSATNGNPAPGDNSQRMGANQVLYYASTTAGDDINWTTKEI